jgi:hypothetical protein
MSSDQKHTLDYATPPARHRAPRRQRVLYCVSLPLIAFGFATALGAGDQLLGAIIMSVGALLLGLALPVGSEGGGH